MQTLISKSNQPSVRREAAALSALITMPFEPKLYGGKGLEQQVSLLMKRAEKMLIEDYFSSEIRTLIEHLHFAFRSLNFHTFTRSVAIFVSASSHKVIYPDMPLKEEIVLSNSIHTRDLLRMKQQSIEYLVLVLNDQWAKTYLGNERGMRLIKCDRPLPDNDRKPAGPRPADKRKTEMHRSFYKSINDGFMLISKAYQVPVFLIGNVRKANFFQDIVSTGKDIVQVIYENTDHIKEKCIFGKLQPYFKNWNYIKQRYLRRQLEDVSKRNRVRSGIEQVSRDIDNLNQKRLLIENS